MNIICPSQPESHILGHASPSPTGDSVVRPRAVDHIVICLAVVGGYLLVWPIGEYAIIDDWAYIKSLRYLLQDGQLKILDWNPMSLVGHLFWGAIFGKLFGSSFTVTKISVVVLSLLESLVFYRLLIMCNVPRFFGLAATFVLMFHPLHFIYNHTFMTDTPAICWQVVSVFFFVKGLCCIGHVASRDLALGSMFAGLAYLCRQNAVLPAIAAVICALTFDRKRLTAQAWFSIVCPVAIVVIVFNSWYYLIHGPTVWHIKMSNAVASFLVHPPLFRLPVLFLGLTMYLAAGVAPIALSLPIVSVSVLRTRTSRIFFGLSALVLVECCIYFGLNGDLFPYFRNTVTRYGYFGINEFLAGERLVVWGGIWAWAISLVLLAAAIAFLRYAIGGLRVVDSVSTASRSIRYVSIWLGLQMAYAVVASENLFDRHLIVFIPAGLAILAIAASTTRRLNWIVYATSMIPMAYYSVAGTHDIHAVSRAAFVVGDALTAKGLDPRQICAGYAYDCWQMYEDQSFDPTRPWHRVRVWWLRDLLPEARPEYVISFSPSNETTGPAETIQTESIQMFLPPSTLTLYVLRLDVNNAGNPNRSR